MLKKILITLGILISLPILCVVIFLLTFDLNHYRSFVETQASQALGRTVEIESLSTKLSLIPTIKVEGVRIKEENQKEPVLEIPKLEAVIELTSLINGQIMVQKISIPNARFVWAGKSKKTTTKATASNSSKGKSSSSASSQKKLWIDMITIDSLKCKITQDKTYEFQINNFSIKELSKFSFDIVYKKKTISVVGNLGSILELAQKKQNLPVDLVFSQNKATLKLNGKIADVENLRKMNFRLDANIPNLSTFLKRWGIKSDKIPTSTAVLKTSFQGDLDQMTIGETSFTIGQSDFALNMQGAMTQLRKNFGVTLNATSTLKEGTFSELLGLKPFELNGKITISKETLSLSDLKFNANKSDAHGQLKFNFAAKPLSLSGNIESTYFDIYDILKTSKTTTSVTSQEQGTSVSKTILSSQKLPFDMLEKMDTNLKVNITHLKFSSDAACYAALNGKAEIKKAELNLPLTIGIWGGTIKNQIKIHGQQKTVSLETDAKNIQLNKVKFLNKDIQNVLANMTFSFRGKGDNLHALASSANGQITAELTSGQIINKWFNNLPTTLNILKGLGSSVSFSTQDQKTELICGGLNIPIRDGIIISQNQIALETNTLNFVINGQIDLKKETLNLTMIPSINKTRGMANELLSASQSISLTGPWTGIETKVNAGEMAANLAQTALQKITGQKENSEQKTVPSGTLCQKALGRTLTQTKKTSATTPAKKETKTTSTTTPKTQPDLKQQLIQSLSQALTDQVTKQ